MGFLGIKTPCLIPCLPPFTFGCREEDGSLPCQDAYYDYRAKKKRIEENTDVTKKQIEEETDVVKAFGADYVDALDAASTGDSNRSSGAEEIGAFGELAGEVTSAIAMTGLLDGILGGDDDEDDGAANSANTPLGQFAFSNTALVFGGIGLGLLLLSQRSR